MYKKLVDFVKYNNAFTILFVVFFFSFGITFAANPTVREGVYASEETVVSVDNGRIVSADLDNFNFNLRINAVTEDEKNYYATYSYQTLVVEDSIWRDKEIEKTLTVSKEALDGKDFGLYLAKELGENMNYELSYLKRVQKLEIEKGKSQKVITTEYSGLIGKLLDPKELVIEGYDPVIPEVVPEVPATVESNPEEVIVSTPYTPPTENSTPASPASEPTPIPETSTSTPEVPPEITLEPTPATSTPTSTPITEPTPPTPAEMVDEELIDKIVDELLQDEPTPTPEPTSVIEPTAPISAPEVVPEVTAEPTQ